MKRTDKNTKRRIVLVTPDIIYSGNFGPLSKTIPEIRRYDLGYLLNNVHETEQNPSFRPNEELNKQAKLTKLLKSGNFFSNIDEKDVELLLEMFLSIQTTQAEINLTDVYKYSFARNSINYRGVQDIPIRNILFAFENEEGPEKTNSQKLAFEKRKKELVKKKIFLTLEKDHRIQGEVLLENKQYNPYQEGDFISVSNAQISSPQKSGKIEYENFKITSYCPNIAKRIPQIESGKKVNGKSNPIEEIFNPMWPSLIVKKDKIIDWMFK